MKRVSDNGIQSAVRLPRALHERLKGAGGHRGLGEEIRRRLEASFEAEDAPTKPKLQRLLDAITYVAGEAATYCGDPFEDAYAFEVLRISVEAFLAAARPKGDVVLDPERSDLLTITLGPDLSPKDISVIFVSDVMRERANEVKRR